LRIAIISDIHIGDKARRYDLKPRASVSSGTPAYLEEFRNFVHDYKISADFLFLPGDIANHAVPEEYEL
jgi:3',5'-cyclic AMP phosphodiesterase CpdA